MVSPAIDHSVRLLRALRHAGHPVFALSNFGMQTFEMARIEFPFLDEFDQRFISAHLGVNKPDAAIYQAVEAGCGIAPDALLFTDDLPTNIDAAAKRGWQTYLFDGSQGLADRLVSEGLLTQEAAQ
jgi:2-haloacid dehalogenase